MLTIKTFGQLQIFCNKKLIIPRRKRHMVLVYLAAQGQPVNNNILFTTTNVVREPLADLLWRDARMPSNRLNEALSNLLKKDGVKQWLFKEGKKILTLQNYECDLCEFEHLLTEPKTIAALEKAAELYQGSFLKDEYVEKAEAFNEWITTKRQYLHNQAVELFLSLAIYHLQQYQIQKALYYIEKVLQLDNLDERATLLKVGLLWWGTDKHAALRAYEQHQQHLLKELNVPPSDDIETLIPHIQNNNGDAVKNILLSQKPYFKIQESPAPQASLPTTPYFVGRKAEHQQLCQQIQDSTTNNIHVIIGMGGVGKTTLAAHVATTIKESFPDGILRADLTEGNELPILENWLAKYNIDAKRLDEANKILELKSFLKKKQILILLENVTSAKSVRQLIPQDSPSKVLVTTRSLDVAYALTDAPQIKLLKELPLAAGRQLILKILQKNKRQTADVKIIEEICMLLQNLPLALEIVAKILSRQPHRPIIQILDQLRDQKRRLMLLAISDVAVRASFEISWQALSPKLQHIFAQLAVFEGRPFSLTALAAITATQPNKAVNHLYELVSYSLLTQLTSPDEHHYVQHTLLAAFAYEKLTPNERTVYQKLANYYARFAQKQQEAHPTLRTEWDNIMAGWQIAYQYQQWQIVLDYAQALSNTIFALGRYTDARQGFAWAAEAATTLSDEVALAHALLNWGQACLEQNDLGKAQSLFTQSIEKYKALNDLKPTIKARYNLARIALEQSDFETATTLHDENHQISQQLNYPLGVAATYHGQARLTYRRGLYAEATQQSQKALQIQQTLNDKGEMLGSLRLLIDIAVAQKERQLAEQYAHQAEAIAIELDEKGELAAVQYALAAICRLQDKLPQAQAYALQSLTAFQQMGERRPQAHTLTELSYIHEKMAEFETAVTYCQQSIAILQELNDELGVAYNLLQLGDLHQHRGRHDQAQQAWQQAFTIADTLHHTKLRQALYNRLHPDEEE